MKCFLCNKAVCGCAKEVVLPTKSTLSSSVTEFPDTCKHKTEKPRSKIPVRNYDQSRPVRNYDQPRRSPERVVQKLSFDSRMDLLNDTRTPGRCKPMQASQSFLMPREQFHPKPFPAFEDYTKRIQNKLQDCVMCSKVLLGQPCDQSFAQQVRAEKHLNCSRDIHQKQNRNICAIKTSAQHSTHFLSNRERKRKVSAC